MMVIIIIIELESPLGYTYKRSVASFSGLGGREERKVYKVKPDSFVAFLPIKEVEVLDAETWF